MEFFFLLISNVFIGAVLYLVISLKLEKKSSEFREKKFRREMDEVIKEFNITAERNISILENRIEMLKRLMEKNGDIKSIDLCIDEGKTKGYDNKMENEKTKIDIIANEEVQDNKKDDIVNFKKSLLNFTGKVKSSIINIKENILEKKGSPPVFHDQVIIEKDLSRIDLIDSEIPIKLKEDAAEVNEDEILEVLSSSDDRYSAIYILHDKGCPAEVISRYSGIPVGEVKLVLNLSNR